MIRSRGYLGATAVLVFSLAAAEDAGNHAPPAGGPPGGGPPPEIVALFKTCAADLKTNCGSKEGPDAMMCLISSKDKASPDCKAALDKLPAGPPGGGGPPGAGGPPPGGAAPKQ